MFEFIDPQPDGRGRMARAGTVAASAVLHAVVLAVVIALPLLYVSEALPSPPDMMAVVLDAAPPPPPPPPPPPAAPAERPRPQPKPAPRPVEPVVSRTAAPVEPPSDIAPEIDIPAATSGVVAADFSAGYGGVAGGVPGGVAGGTLGGTVGAPPPLPRVSRPIRIGGQVRRPELLKRVQPIYPPVAQAALIEGTVILEATVDQRGRVTSVEVLRSHPLLARAAVDAVKQWQYAPLRLNGVPHPFVLTVTVSFALA